MKINQKRKAELTSQLKANIHQAQQMAAKAIIHCPGGADWIIAEYENLINLLESGKPIYETSFFSAFKNWKMQTIEIVKGNIKEVIRHSENLVEFKYS